jgi:hypothetical protein
MGAGEWRDARAGGDHLQAFMSALVDAALAERPDIEAEERAVDELNARRREHATREPDFGLPLIPKPAIAIDPLFELVPDLRDEVRSIDMSAAAEPLGRSNDEPEGLREAGFGIGDVVYANDGGVLPLPPAA